MKACALVFCALALASCGGGGVEVLPTAPATPPPTPPPLGGVVVTFVSGETGEAVPGARVEVGGAAYITDAWGRVGLQALGLTTVTAGGYLPRRLELAGEGRQVLWPLSRQTTELWVDYLVYRNTNQAQSRRSMWRLPAGEAWLELEAGEDAEVVRAAELAAREVTRATGGVVRMAVGRGAGPTFRVVVEPERYPGPDGSLALSLINVAGGWITGGELSFRELQYARRLELVLHEVGHALGMGHATYGAPGELQVMAPGSAPAATTYSPQEQLGILMMYQRSAGNVFPDDAPGLVLAGQASGRIEIACP